MLATETGGHRRRPRADRHQTDSSPLQLTVEVAQLRDPLPGEQSPVVPDEDGYEAASDQVLTQGGRAAVRVVEAGV